MTRLRNSIIVSCDDLCEGILTKAQGKAGLNQIVFLKLHREVDCDDEYDDEDSSDAMRYDAMQCSANGNRKCEKSMTSK